MFLRNKILSAAEDLSSFDLKREVINHGSLGEKKNPNYY
jgi:hypothetical protein